MAILTPEARIRWDLARGHVLPLLAWSVASALVVAAAATAATTVPALAALALLALGPTLALMQRAAGATMLALRGSRDAPAPAGPVALVGLVGVVAVGIATASAASSAAAFSSTNAGFWLVALAAAAGGGVAALATTAVLAAAAGLGEAPLGALRALRERRLRPAGVVVAVLAVPLVAAIGSAHPPALLYAPPCAALAIAAAVAGRPASTVSPLGRRGTTTLPPIEENNV